MMSLSFASICVCSASIALAFAATAVPATSKSFSCVCSARIADEFALTELSVRLICVVSVFSSVEVALVISVAT